MSTETTFAALPVRQRGTLEVIDTAMKLYRRYFGVLMGWSALVTVLFVLASTVPFGAFLVYPFIASSCACCIAAAVRGQGVSFGQVWEFSKPRYGALLIITLLSSLLLGVLFGAAFLVSMLITLAGAWALSALNAPEVASLWLGGIGVLIALVVGSVLGVFAYAWVGLVPIIACLEDDKRGSAALGRAWDLMKGSWGRVLGLSALLTLAVVAAMGIVGGALGLFGVGFSSLADNPTESGLLMLGLLMAGFWGLFLLFWNPIQGLILAVLYLDLRVRKEALDLEWNAYATTPAVENSAPETAPSPSAPEVAGQLAAQPLIDQSLTSEPAPASFAASPDLPATDANAVTVSPAPAPPSVRPPAPVEQGPSLMQESAQNPSPALATQTSSFSAVPSSSDAAASEQIPAPQDASDFSTSFSAGGADAADGASDADRREEA